MYPTQGQIVLGSANFGVKSTEDGACAILDAFAESGGALIDTAAVYSDWIPGELRRSERIIGDWLAGRPRTGRPAIATKGAHPLLTDMATPRLDRASIIGDVEQSLRQLRVEAIDLFYLHRDDTSLPVEAIMGPLKDVVDAGKVRHVGVSNWTTARLAEARRSGIVPISSNQVRGNILVNLSHPPKDPSLVTLDESVLTEAEAGDQSVLLFSAQAGGVLSKPGAVPPDSAHATAAGLAAIAEIRAIAADLKVDPTALSLRVLMSLSPRLSPVIGPNSVAQLHRSLAASGIDLPADFRQRLSVLFGFAGWRGTQTTPA